MLNQKLDEIRRDLYHDETEYNKGDLIKGIEKKSLWI